jgi:RNA polymerase sigma factor (sigma-70 family)
VSNVSQNTEQELLQSCCKGNRQAQFRLYQLFSKKMMAVCLRYAKSVPEAEDIVQEGFIKVFQHIQNFKGESKLETWITRIMVNTALNSNRRKMYLFPMVDVSDIQTPIQDNVLQDLSFESLLKLIQGLPTGCQVVFNLYAIEGYTHQEIAELLNISEGTSKSQYARAKELLKKQIKAESENLKYGKRG